MAGKLRTSRFTNLFVLRSRARFLRRRRGRRAAAERGRIARRIEADGQVIDPHALVVERGLQPHPPVAAGEAVAVGVQMSAGSVGRSLCVGQGGFFG